VLEVTKIVPFTGHSCYFRCAFDGPGGLPDPVRVGVATETFRGNAGEILRQASVALEGRPVTLWEVGDGPSLIPRASSDLASRPQPSHIDFDSTLKRWGVPIRSGSRYLGCQLAEDGSWVMAPVRLRPAAGPPGGRERRSPTRLTLELAGLCLGLSDRREAAEIERAPVISIDPLKDLLTLPSVVAHEARNPLTGAKAGLQLTMESLGRMEDLPVPRRLELLEELGEVLEALTRALDFLQAVQDRARGAIRGRERFEVVGVVRSVIALEGRVLRQQGIDVELVSTLDTVHLNGDPNLLYELLINLVRNAAEASSERRAPITVRMEREGETLRLSVTDRGVGIPAYLVDRVFEPGFTTKSPGDGGAGLTVVRKVAQEVFGGTVAVKSTEGAGTTFAVSLPIPVQRAALPPFFTTDS
jgi:signal transduction histidine kinase